MAPERSSLNRLKEIAKEIRLLQHTNSLLQWDMETYMPPKAVEGRSEQMAYTEGLIHQKSTSEEVAGLLEQLGANSEQPTGDPAMSEIDAAIVREFFRHHTRLSKLPEKLVKELAKTTGVAHSVWVEAREKNEYKLFSPILGKIVGIVCEIAQKIGYSDHIYDALLEDYEPWTTTKEVADVFSSLEKRLVAIVNKIRDSRQIDDGFLFEEFPVDRQEAFGREVLEKMGFDISRGRLDVSAHPFTSTLGDHDVRLTTRYQSDFFKTSIFGIIHEAGHGLYELGFGEDIQGTVLADGVSLGVHESQSRSWENMVGRSLPFWRHFYPILQKYFPEPLDAIPLEKFYKAINKVEPSLIRVEADEVTYSLHVMLRFNIERKIVTGEVEIDDLPALWNSQMEDLLGIKPDSDSNGILQDVHWSMGYIGYFPTYALGNLYGAQFVHQMRDEIGDIDASLEAGDMKPILNWQRKKIHRHGKIYPAQELCRRITGETLDSDYFINYLESKYADIYGF